MPNAPHSLMPYAIAQKEEKTIGVHKAVEKRDFLPFLSRLRNVRRRSFAITGANTNAERSTQKKKNAQQVTPGVIILRAKTDDGTFCTHGTFCAHISPAKMILA